MSDAAPVERDTAPAAQSSSADCSANAAVLVKSADLARLMKLSELCVDALCAAASGSELQLAHSTRSQLVDSARTVAFKLRTGLRRLASEQAQEPK